MKSVMQKKLIELVLAQTDLGILTIKGDDLKMNRLNLDNNELIVEGQIIAVAYSDVNQAKKSGFMNKLFNFAVQIYVQKLKFILGSSKI